ncbi:unnamed protein product [Oncorhynchus mykiss]|uniref:Solute carrier organic anion transporter family member 1C1 n=1 Tax=Oncorhynchus mykiss TaxID=8022 RepID=A0A060W817_ONCMY|nr:unnamed protein product [Oncorhynchus mykiss]
MTKKTVIATPLFPFSLSLSLILFISPPLSFFLSLRVGGVSYEERSVFSACNSDCVCSGRDWDPVCGENGITYVSPCLAGCQTSTGSGKNTVFSNCSCVVAAGLSSGNLTASVGHCPHRDDCDRVFPYFLALSVITSFIISLGGTPGYMVLIRSVTHTHTPTHTLKQERMVIAVGKKAQRNLGLRQGILKGK